MRVKDIKIGEFYRVKGNDFCWAQAIEILPPKRGINTTKATLIKCKWVTSKKFANDGIVLIKYFRVSELVKEPVE